MSLPDTLATSEPPKRPDTHVGLLVVWTPVLTLLFAAVLLVALGFVIDESSLDQPSDSWGYLFGAVAVTVMYGAPVLVGALCCAIAGSLFRSASARIALAVAGAVVVALGGLALVGFMVSLVFNEPQAGQVFGAGAIVVGLGLLLPLVWCLRRRSTLLSNQP